MTAWMAEAWDSVGVREVPGKGANPRILKWFHELDLTSVTDDVVPHCAVFVGACLKNVGIDPPREWKGRPDKWAAARARAYETVGQELHHPVVGAIGVIPRGRNPDQGHVFFISGFTDTHVMGLGANQNDEVNVTPFKISALTAIRWPGPAATIQEIAAAGSQTATASLRQRGDAAKAAAVQVPGQAAAQAPAADLIGTATAAKQQFGVVDGLLDFAQFAWAKAPWIAAAVGAYYFARMVWDAGWISSFRARDHNTGANAGRVTLRTEIMK